MKEKLPLVYMVIGTMLFVIVMPVCILFNVMGVAERGPLNTYIGGLAFGFLMAIGWYSFYRGKTQ